MRERCRCGNQVPIGELKDGCCRVCVWEAEEKLKKEKEAQHLFELRNRYADWYTP